jgi:alkylation response protein AidB-like acyl-CoA dehydrogenase
VPYLPTPDHDELRAVVRELATERIAPRAAEIDEKQEFPWDLKELLAQQDLLGTCFAERHGGTALDEVAQAILVEEIARADATTSLIPAVQKLDPAGRQRGAAGPIPPAPRIRRVAGRLRADRGRRRQRRRLQPDACRP